MSKYIDEPTVHTASNIDDLLAKVAEIKALLPLPDGVPGRTDQICTLAKSISRKAPNASIADLARKVASEARDAESSKISTYLSHLTAELEEARKQQ